MQKFFCDIRHYWAIPASLKLFPNSSYDTFLFLSNPFSVIIYSMTVCELFVFFFSLKCVLVRSLPVPCGSHFFLTLISVTNLSASWLLQKHPFLYTKLNWINMFTWLYVSLKCKIFGGIGTSLSSSLYPNHLLWC